MKKVKVKLLVNTAYQGPRKEGDVISVPEDFANRWVKNGIAELVDEDEVQIEEEAAPVGEAIPEGDTTEETEEEEAEETEEKPIDLASMTAKELFARCKEEGLDVEPKKGKDYYIEALTQHLKQ